VYSQKVDEWCSSELWLTLLVSGSVEVSESFVLHAAICLDMEYHLFLLLCFGLEQSQARVECIVTHSCVMTARLIHATCRSHTTTLRTQLLICYSRTSPLLLTMAFFNNITSVCVYYCLLSTAYTQCPHVISVCKC